MSEIEIGEYARLHYGKIDRVKNNDYYMQQYIECEKGLYPRENIVKHSKNIIDLIEVGDYVNGEPVEEVICTDDEFEITTITEYLTNLEDIKSIVTKEQFEQVQYKVGD